MVIIRGNRRVADIYFTEFNRLFNHYYFRSVVEATRERLDAGTVPAATPSTATQFLDTTGDWLKKYEPGKLRHKRVEAYRNMKGFT